MPNSISPDPRFRVARSGLFVGARHTFICESRFLHPEIAEATRNLPDLFSFRRRMSWSATAHRRVETRHNKRLPSPTVHTPP
jgi:hypothetical protein